MYLCKQKPDLKGQTYKYYGRNQMMLIEGRQVFEFDEDALYT